MSAILDLQLLQNILRRHSIFFETPSSELSTDAKDAAVAPPTVPEAQSPPFKPTATQPGNACSTMF
jgi:hypothetical protein